MTALNMLVAAPFAPMSPSVAEMYQLCPQKELLNHFYIESEFNESLHKGQAFHNTVHDAAKKFQTEGNWPGMDEIIPILRKHLAELPKNELQSTDREMLEHRVDRWQDDLLEALVGLLVFVEGKINPGDLISTEEWVRLDLNHSAGRVRATGRIDLLVRVAGELWVIDIKTGKVPEDDEISGPMAMALYVTSVRKNHPDTVVRAFELYPAGQRLLEYETDNVEADLLKLVTLGQHHFTETEWPKHKGAHCNWCDHHRRCIGSDELAAD